MSSCSLTKQGTELNHWLSSGFNFQGCIYCIFIMYISEKGERKGVEGECSASLELISTIVAINVIFCTLNKF